MTARLVTRIDHTSVQAHLKIADDALAFDNEFAFDNADSAFAFDNEWV